MRLQHWCCNVDFRIMGRFIPSFRLALAMGENKGITGFGKEVL